MAIIYAYVSTVIDIHIDVVVTVVVVAYVGLIVGVSCIATITLCTSVTAACRSNVFCTA